MTKRKGETVKLTLPVSERDHIQGSLTAPVTLVEYGDYECPYCAQAYLITKEVQERLGTKLGFVFRNFPITKLRPNSYQVALAASLSCYCPNNHTCYFSSCLIIIHVKLFIQNFHILKSAFLYAVDIIFLC